MIVVTSSDTGAVSASPGRLTFTSDTWDEEQEVTLTAVSDSDGDNESVTIIHSSSGSRDVAYAALTEIDSVTVSVVEDGSARSDDTSSFLQSSSCDGDVTLTWNSPTTGDATIASYRIEWRSGKEQFDSSRSSTAEAGATSYTLSSLTNGVEYTIRVVGLDQDGMAVWSRETTATPSATSCITEVNFGNILYDSAPVIVEIDDPDPGTQVNLRLPEPESRCLERCPDQASCKSPVESTGHIRHLRFGAGPRVRGSDMVGRKQDAAASTDVGTASVAQTIFKTPAAPEGVTIRAGAGAGGGAFSKIIRIEPSITSVTVGAGDEVIAVGGGVRQAGDP